MTYKQKRKLIKKAKETAKRWFAGTFAGYFFLTTILTYAPMVSSYALTSGPSQPEAQSFEPIGTSNMVDPFSGDYTYNIPLLDVEGYPINLAYHSGISMDQEASWVGLGWNVNVGTINRALRGLPDDFNGDEITTETNIKKNWTLGIDGSVGDLELFGKELGDEITNAANQVTGTVGTEFDLNMNVGVNYNNYNGVGFTAGVGLNVATKLTENSDLIGGGGLGLNSSSSGGLDISPSLNLSKKMKDKESHERNLNGNIGSSFNSRAGLSNLSIGVSITASEYKDVSINNITKRIKTKKGRTVGLNGSFNLMQSTYTPSITNSMRSFAITGRVKWAGDLSGADVGFSLGVSYSEQALANNIKTTPAYGYLYSHNGQNNEDARHDYNRENESSVSPSTPNLALTNYTYDIYSVSGQGTGGSYRPFRNQIGYVYDNAAYNTSSSTPITVELGTGFLFHGGSQLGATSVKSNSGPWTYGYSPFDGDNSADEVLNFKKTDGAPDSEYYTFREASEASVWTDPAYYNNLGKDHAVKLKLNELSRFNVALEPKIDGPHTSSTAITRGYKQGRVKRNATIQNLSINQVKNLNIGINHFISGSYANNGAKKHHIGQITSLGNDGMRYVYGQPAYNLTQEEVTFAVGKTLTDPDFQRSRDYEKGLVTYSSGDNSPSNNLGLDNYYQKVSTPPYAHSYLLTSVLSNDYVDVDGTKGPSIGDLGSYTKFEYTQAYNHNAPFKWRIPVGTNLASYNEGLKGDYTDDKGSYLYGEKEIFYLNKIETKNFVAIFYLSERDDALGVDGENGTVNHNAMMQKLDSIALYTKPDYDAYIANNTHTPTALKTVHFLYDYSLCQNTPNSKAATTHGKLTLKKVFFTYRASQKGKLSPYEFHYDGLNPDYNLKGYDRWGIYKTNPPTGTSGTGLNNYIGLTEPIPTYEYPYTDQDNASADDYASAWTMTSIDLPSGGTITMDYEADDYYYVQNKPAMEMAKIVSVGDDNGTPQAQGIGQVYEVATNTNKNRKIFFRKDANHAAHEYTDGIKDIYFRCLTSFSLANPINQFTNPGGRYDYVSGYAEIKNVGDVSTDPTLGWIELEPVSFRDHNPNNSNPDKYNPIALNGIQFGQLHLSKYVWDSPALPEEGGMAIDAMRALYQTFANFIEGFKNPNKALYDRGVGIKIVMEKSWFRLNNVDEKKIGGGCRVHQITINDSWDQMGGSTSADYGQTYTYTTTKMVNGEKVEISSGVAAYEPQLGGDENPWKQPIYFSQKKRMAPDPKFYQETPLGESFFPSASVGYSRVEVKNLKYSSVKRNATGSVVHEFYTAKDFPTKVEKTDIDPVQHKNSPFSIASIFKIDAKDYYTGSQGFSIITNDMHGKPKSQMVYQEDQDEPITKVAYFYQQKPSSEVSAYETVNDVKVINKNGTVETRPIGINFDLVADFRENTTQVKSISANLNVDGLFLGLVALPFPMIWPKITKEKTMFRSATLTKVVQKFGVMEKTVATDLGSVVETRNLAYDAQTGQVLVTETATDFNDKVYTMNFPAYWYYDNMGQAYKNIGFTIKNVQSNNGIVSTNSSGYFVEGDEIMAILNGSPTKLWVTNVSSNNIVLQDFAGNYPSGSISALYITRSGRRNMQSQMMASITTRKNPLNSFQSNVYENVLQASAIEFSDEWRTFCDCNGTTGDYSTNPYVLGTRGNYKPKVSYLHLSDRTQSDYNNNTNIRRDGAFKSFSPYYRLNSSAKWEVDRRNWTYTAEVTEFNPFGQELQNRDALGRESAAQFGYNQTLAKAVAANAGYRDIGFSSFEDDDFSPCADNHFKFEQPQYRTRSDAHTGRYSVRVSANNSVTMHKDLQRCDQTGCDLSLTTKVNYGILELSVSGGEMPYTTDVNILSGNPIIVPSDNGPRVNLSGTFSIEYTVFDAKGCKDTKVINVINGRSIQ